jgi:hypothetical protein
VTPITPMPPKRVALTTLAAALVGLTSAHASAQETRRTTPSDATIIAIDTGDLVIDLGANKGAREGQTVELWRPMRLRHPVTGQMLVDRFRIGSVRITQAQSLLSLAKVEGTFVRSPQPGDLVFLPDDARPPPASALASTRKVEVKGAAPGAPVTTTPAPVSGIPCNPGAEPARAQLPTDADAQVLSDLFVALQGADPAARASAYTAFVAAHPKSRFAKVLNEEVDALSHAAHERAPFATASVTIARVRPGVPQRFAVELDDRFVGAVVHVRRRGAKAYRSIPMDGLGPRYWGATLPGDAIVSPGMEYFVEGVPAGGLAAPVIGSADEPRDAVVDPHPLTGKAEGTLAQISLQSEFAAFNTKKANDYLFQTEGQFGWRLGDEGIRAVRSGFGVLRGKGGSLEELDVLRHDPKGVGLTYGYIEGEIGITPGYGLIARPIIGLREGGVVGGAQGFVRIGNDLRTNLLVGGEILGSVGIRGVVELSWRTIPRVPIMLRSEVTNQPAGMGSDVGARAIAQVGYEIVRDFTVAARGSYQGRTINHAGPGAGLGVSYQW